MNQLQNLSVEMIAIIALAIFCIVLLVLFINQQRRISRLLRGNNTMTIEDSIVELAKELDSLAEFRTEAEKYFSVVERRLRKSVQAIETKRFNPFKGTGAGGNQSFASAFVNELGDGLVLSSLYSSDRVSIFAKPVQKFKSQYELTEEEEHALTDAESRATQYHL